MAGFLARWFGGGGYVHWTEVLDIIREVQKVDAEYLRQSEERMVKFVREYAATHPETPQEASADKQRAESDTDALGC